MKPLLYIFDADDTLRFTQTPGLPCPHRRDDWQLLPGVSEALRRIPWSTQGPYLGVASNQDRIGYGLLTHALVQELLESMVREAVGLLNPPAAIRYCPHRADEGCPCRKPAPGMLLAIMAHFRVFPGQTVFVGDADTDREAARRAGVAFVHADAFFARRGMFSDSGDNSTGPGRN